MMSDAGRTGAIYLDNAATSYPKPECVYEAVDSFMRQNGASSGRGTYRRALAADELVSKTRRLLADLLGAEDDSRIVLLSGATEALNLAIKGLVQPGDNVVTSSMEHNAVWRCLRELEAAGILTVTRVPCAEDGTMRVSDLAEALCPNTRLVALVHASNVTGTLLPVEAVARVVKERGIALLVDAAQTIGVLPFTVQELGADLLAFPGHKGLLGPQGTGGLYVGQGVELRPLKAGGTGRESLLEVMPPALPDRFEAGTANVPGISGLGAGVEFVLREGVARIREREMALSEYTLAGLRSIPKVEVYGPRDAESRIGVISFNVSGLGPEQVAYALDEAYGIMVRAGLHCAPCAHRTIGTLDKGTVRVGLGLFNTVEDIDRLLEAVRGVAEVV